jgi:hypothetical protein
MTNEGVDEEILVERMVTARGIVMGALRSAWRSFLDSAAMYGATLYGSPELIRPDPTREADNK